MRRQEVIQLYYHSLCFIATIRDTESTISKRKKTVSYRWAFTYLSWLSGVLGIVVGATALFDTRKFWAVQLSPRFTAEGYHKWLASGASKEDLKVLAIADDSAITGLQDMVLILACCLIVGGILNGLILGYVLYKTRKGEKAES
jgi:hypothetical protein